MAEAIRLVIWDLDETFWHGTVTEGGYVWREDAAAALRGLAARGIVSAICSRNDAAQIEGILAERGVAGYFVFNSISWEAKGPRLAALVRAVQLRPETVLFIDDNPANLAEAAAFVPGIQLAAETIIPRLLEDTRCAGRPDPDLTRLAQYKLLEQRQAGVAQAGGDNGAFLRASGIVVRIEHDLEPHLDRAIELINRTNQLNFTKQRLPEDQEAARIELRALLSEHTIQAGLLHVRDTYGDHGFCGIYVMRSRRGMGRKLLHFAFSCRILGMGVETWLYRRLKRPAMRLEGPVLTDIVDDMHDIDWIDVELAGVPASSGPGGHALSYVLARGGCDMRAVAHYFGGLTGAIYEEFDTARDGQNVLVNHSLIATQAMAGIAAEAVADFAPFGFRAEDFDCAFSREMPAGPAVWLLGFAIESHVPIFRHRATGALLPWIPPGLGAGGDPALMMRGEPQAKPAGPRAEVDQTLMAHARARFDYEGLVLEASFQASLRMIFGRAQAGVQVFVLLSNTRTRPGYGGQSAAMVAQNAAIAGVAKDFPCVELLAPLSFMSETEIAAMEAPHHYDRIVYFRMFKHIMARMHAHEILVPA